MALIAASLVGARAPAIIVPPAVLAGTSQDIWLPDYWYRSGEPGDYWHLSNLDGIYQESTGITPAAVGQAVGLMLGRRYGGARGSEKVSNGEFTSDLTRWTNTGGTTGTWDAGTMRVAWASAAGGRYQDITVSQEATVEITVRCKKISGTASVWGVPSASFTSPTIIAVTNTDYADVRFVVTANTTVVRAYVSASAAASEIQVDSISVRELPGLHRIQSTAINRPILRQDATGRYYLEYNGSNSWMQTASTVDLTSTDKVTLVSGVYKGSDAAAGIVHELSATSSTNNGSFALLAPQTAAATYGAYVRGNTATAINVSAASFAAPHTAVITGLFDIGAASGAENGLRVNGSGPIYNGIDAGAGNFGNYTLYSGARNGGASALFTGREYATILRGAASTLADIQRAERWTERLTGTGAF